MTNALKDENGRNTLIATLNSDGTSIVRIKADPSTHALKVDDNTTGSDNGNNGGNAMLDENSVPVLIALSSAGDGKIVEVYTDSSGNLLIDSN